MDTEKERIITLNFIFIFAAQLFNTIIMYMLITTLADHATALGANLTMAGLVSGIYIIGAIISRLFAGLLMELFGWKRVGMIFAVGQLLGCILYFFSNTVWMLVIARFIHGFFFGGTSSAVITLGSSMLPKSRYSEAMGYFLLASTVAMGIGPYIGGVIFDKAAATGCFISAAVFSLLCVITLLLFDASGIEKNRERVSASSYSGIEKLIDKRAIPISVCETLAAISYASVLSFYRPYGEQLGLEKVFSFYFVIYSFVLLFSRPLAGRLQDKRGDNVVLYPAAVIQSIGLVLFALIPNVVTTVLSAVSIGLGFGTLTSVINAMACKICPEDRRAYAVATYWVFTDIGTGFGPAIMGFAANMGGYRSMYLFAALVMFCMIPYYYLVWGRYSRRT